MEKYSLETKELLAESQMFEVKAGAFENNQKWYYPDVKCPYNNQK